VVGINTAIISTSGSNAGIGFAVPADQLRPVVDRILRDDRIKDGKRPDGGWLGASVVQTPPQLMNDDDYDQSSAAAATSKKSSLLYTKTWVASVEPGSPASREGIVPLRILKDSGRVELGDAIVAVAGNEVATWEELQTELQDRVTGEKVALTLENVAGDRRVVYVTLEDKPSKKGRD
jgi:serine protease Do